MVEKNNTELEKIRKQPEFKNLTDSEFNELSQHFYKRTYKKGQVLFDCGDKRNRLYHLVEGVVKCERVDPSGDYFYLNFHKQEAFFPYLGLFSDYAYDYTVQALTDIEVYYFPTEVFEKVAKQNNNEMTYLITTLSEILKQHILKIQGCVTSSAADRIKYTLALLMVRLGEKNYYGEVEIPYPILLNDISRSSGATRETTSHVIKKLVDEKKISYKHKYLTYHDLDFFDLDFSCDF